MLREKQYGAKIDLCLFVNNFIPVINIDEKVAKELFSVTSIFKQKFQLHINHHCHRQ